MVEGVIVPTGRVFTDLWGPYASMAGGCGGMTTVGAGRGVCNAVGCSVGKVSSSGTIYAA